MAEVMNTWEAIREGANDVERLIGQKRYNLAMVKARQTLEIMVRTLAERSGVQVTDMATTIDELYRRGIITQTTAEHYHKIRMIGNKAAHEGDENPSGANTAYHLLSQELYTFAKDFSSGNRRPRSSQGYGRVGQSSRSAGNDPADLDTGNDRYASEGSSNRGSTSQRSSRSIDEHNVRRASHRTSKKSSVTPELIFKVMIPILVILLIIGCIVLINNKKEKPEETEPELQTIMETTMPVTEPPTEPPTEPETVTLYTVTADKLNVRAQPSTDGEKLGQLSQGDTVSYISDYDDQWILINYNDQEGYVSKEFIDVRSVDLATFESEAEAAAEEALDAQGEEAADAQ